MNMRSVTSLAVAAALMLVGLPSAPAAAQISAESAKSLCRDRLRSNFNASASNVTASYRGSDRFSVTGSASRNGESGRFDCTVEYGRVADINTSDWHKSSNGAGTAVAIGGAIALAAIIAAASSKNRSHEHDRYDRRDYDRDDRYYDDSYSPARDVDCYRNQRACYNSWDHSYNARWSQREFGY